MGDACLGDWCDRVRFLDQGMVFEEDPREVIFRNPANQRMKNFLRKYLKGQH